MQAEPTLFLPYCGQNQQQHINVSAPIASREKGPWAMVPYASLFPQPPDIGTQWLPPPIGKTDLWRAQGTWPL